MDQTQLTFLRDQLGVTLPEDLDPDAQIARLVLAADQAAADLRDDPDGLAGDRVTVAVQAVRAAADTNDLAATQTAMDRVTQIVAKVTQDIVAAEARREEVAKALRDRLASTVIDDRLGPDEKGPLQTLRGEILSLLPPAPSRAQIDSAAAKFKDLLTRIKGFEEVLAKRTVRIAAAKALVEKLTWNAGDLAPHALASSAATDPIREATTELLARAQKLTDWTEAHTHADTEVSDLAAAREMEVRRLADVNKAYVDFDVLLTGALSEIEKSGLGTTQIDVFKTKIDTVKGTEALALDGLTAKGQGISAVALEAKTLAATLAKLRTRLDRVDIKPAGATASEKGQLTDLHGQIASELETVID